MLESGITYKGQTTLPKAVREALAVKAGDRVRYVVVDEGGAASARSAYPTPVPQSAVRRAGGKPGRHGPRYWGGGYRRMISMDTNVLVRYLVGDDVEQAEAARVLLDGLTHDDPGFICREVMMEIAWVLERSYGFTRARVAEALMDLTASDSLVVENSDDAAAAAHRYRQGGADFSDLMTLAAAERAGARPLYTFDRALGGMDGAVLVGGE